MSDGDAQQLLGAYPGWVDFIEAGTLARGRSYAAQARARILSQDDGTIEAICQGSAGETYQQIIRLVVNHGDLRVFGKCSCPVGLNCKHCVAALLQLQDSPDATAPHEQSALSLPPDLNLWVEALESPSQPTPQGPARKGPAIYYRIQVDHGLWRLEPIKGTRQADDTLKIGRITSMPEMLYYTPRYVTEDDARLLRLIDSRRETMASTVQLEGKPGGELYSYALATGRLLFEDDLAPLAPGPELHAEFRWVRLDNGSYRGAWYHNGHEQLQAVPIEPMHYVDRQHHLTGKLRHDLDPFIASQLARAPIVPEHLVIPLSHRLNALNRHVPPPLP